MDITIKNKFNDAFRSKDIQQMADVQYDIWATFLKSTGQNLRNKQLRIMAESSNLIQSLENSKLFSRQQDSTDDSNSSYRRTAFDRQPDNRFNSPQSRILSRKSPRTFNKISNMNQNDSLKDIEQNCNACTVKWIKNILRDYQKVKDKLMDMQTNQKRLKRNIQNFEKEHEHHIILKKIHQDVQKKNSRLENEVSELKIKNKALVEQIENIQARNEKSLIVDTKVVTNLTTFLADKQKNVNYKMNRIIEIENNVLELIHNTVIKDGCQKCCIFVKKVKDAMGKFRKSLQQQSQQVEHLYNRYKTAFCGNSY